jgi:F5/8 type C domain
LNGGLVNDDDAWLPDDAELPDAALVRPYVESLGESATSSEPPARPALPFSEQPTALLPRISLTIRKHSTRARSPRALDSGRPGDLRLVDASLLDAPPARSDRRGRFVIAAAITIMALVVGYFVWDSSQDASGPPETPIVAAVPSLPLQSTIPSQSPAMPPSTRTEASSGAPPPRTPTPSARSSKTTEPFGPGPGNPDPTANLAQGRPVNDTGHNGAYVASNAVDGDPNTYWESTNRAFPQSITVDLGAQMTFDRLVLRLPPLPSWKKRIQWISIQGSQNGNDFRTIDAAAILKFDPASGNQATVNFHSPSYRYVRLTFMGNNRSPAGQAAEIELYSS